jgi:drug/metabolite transporter (DMT)-like permease
MVAVGLASLVWAAVTVATRSITDRYDAWWLNTPGTVLGAVFILLIDIPNLQEFGSLSLKGWLAIIWLGSASSAFIYYVMARVMTVISATTTASLGTVVTPAGVVVAWLVLGNAPTLVEVVGGIVVVGGAVMVTRRPTAEADDVVGLATTGSAG